MNLPHESPSAGDPGNGAGRPPLRLGDLQKTITMAEIAKAAGVSQGAISSLLNDRDYGIRVSEKTRERVFKVCREMGYLPNDLRAVVRMYPELGEFALLISSRFSGGLADAAVARVAAAAMGAVPEASHALAVAFYDEAVDYLRQPERLPQPVATGIVSKFVFLGAPNLSLIQTITQRGCPVVVLGHEVAAPGVHSIVADLAQAAVLALEHLVRGGHRQIAIVSGPFGASDGHILELNRGVRLGCEQLGLPVDARDIIHSDLTASAGAAAFDAMLERTCMPTAVFCMSDAAASGLLARAHARGCAIPAKLSVIGLADDWCAGLASPALTTVRLPLEEMAQLGVQQVDHLVRGGGAEATRKTVLPVRLVERASCAPRKAA